MTTQALSISLGTGRSRFRHRAVPALAFTAALLFAAGQPGFADDGRGIIVDARIPMTCVPPPPNPPGIGSSPPYTFTPLFTPASAARAVRSAAG